VYHYIKKKRSLGDSNNPLEGHDQYSRKKKHTKHKNKVIPRTEKTVMAISYGALLPYSTTWPHL